MMLQQMQQIDFKEKTVFDFGTGTGILAILAEKLGASSIVAIDVDEWSIRNAQENFEQNGCNRIQLYKSSKIPDRQFDVILANINRNVLLQNLGTLKNTLHKNGKLLLSGFLNEDESDIVNACNVLNLRVDAVLNRENWQAQLYLG